jgi:hypothetical protein
VQTELVDWEAIKHLFKYRARAFRTTIKFLLHNTNVPLKFLVHVLFLFAPVQGPSFSEIVLNRAMQDIY